MAPLHDVLSDHRSRAEKEGTRRPYAAFGGAVVPERNLLTRELLSGFAAQFWGQALQSTQPLDGLATSGPGQPPPLPLAAPSGLSRTQFLVASQAVALPCFPSYCAEHGGVVLDRVLLNSGGDGWWAALTGRAKARNLLSAYQDNQLLRQLKNPSNYLLCANSKVSLGSNTVLRLKGEVDGQGWDTRAAAADLHSSASAASAPPLTSATVQLRHKMRGAEARAELGVNRRVLLMGGPSGAASGFASLPVDLTLDVATPSGSASALQYRMGLHHTSGQGLDSDSSLHHAVHLQTAAAVQGETTLWKQRPASRSTTATTTTAARPGKAGATSATPGSAQPAPGPRSAEQGHHASGSAAAGPAASSKHPTKTIGPHNPLRKSLGKVLSSLTGGAVGSGADEAVDRPSRRGLFRKRGTAADSVGADFTPLFNPDQVQEVLLDSTQSISRLREDVQSITSWVSQGKLADSLTQGSLLGPLAPKKRSAKDSVGKVATKEAEAGPQRVTRNAALPQPHFKVGGMLGLVARVPLVHSNSFEPSSAEHQQGRLEQQAEERAQQQEQAGQGQVQEGGEGAQPLVRVPSGMQRLLSRSVDWVQQQLRGDVAQHSATFRPFASGAMLLQLGGMQRGFLDFTRLVAKADVGLLVPRDSLGRGVGKSWSAAALSQPGVAQPGAGGSGLWHALTLSLSQQLIGPVRLCADMRFALEPGCSSRRAREADTDAGSSTSARLKGLSSQVLSTRACLVDSIVALDVALPSTSGLARIVAWYAPGRKEGMVEVRLF